MSKQYTITDQTNTDNTVTGELDDIMETVATWYPEAPVEIFEAIDALEAALTAGKYIRELEAYLALEVTINV